MNLEDVYKGLQEIAHRYKYSLDVRPRVSLDVLKNTAEYLRCVDCLAPTDLKNSAPISSIQMCADCFVRRFTEKEDRFIRLRSMLVTFAECELCYRRTFYGYQINNVRRCHMCIEKRYRSLQGFKFE